jgi:hypothetical protein
MMMRKACPRCHGDLFLDRADGPVVLTCLQCGRSFQPAARQTEGPERATVGAGSHDRAA